jgi:hypothetical protein
MDSRGFMAIVETTGAAFAVVAAILKLVDYYLKAGRLDGRGVQAGGRRRTSVSHSPGDEIGVVLPFALLLNITGAELGMRLEQSVFLDMIGTALAAFVLGPWWAAMLGLTTNALLYFVHAPSYDPLPYALVNMAGGLWWGYALRSRPIRGSFFQRDWDPTAFMQASLILGVVGGVLCALLATAVSILLSARELVVDVNLFQRFAAEALKSLIPNVSDKVASVLMGALMVRSLFPIFVRTEVYAVRDSGKLPITGFIASSVVYGLTLFVMRGTELLVVLSSALLGAAVLGAAFALLFEGRGVSQDDGARKRRQDLYRRLREMTTRSEDAFGYAAMALMLGIVFVAVVAHAYVLQAAAAPSFMGRFAAMNFSLLIIAHVFDVAAKHNRLEQLLGVAAASSPSEPVGEVKAAGPAS